MEGSLRRSAVGGIVGELEQSPTLEPVLLVSIRARAFAIQLVKSADPRSRPVHMIWTVSVRRA